MNARLPLRSFAVASLAFATVPARADLYYNAGAGDMYLRRTNEASVHLLRAEARVGWAFNAWLGLEASVYTSRGASAAARYVTPPVDPDINVYREGVATNTVIVWNRYQYQAAAVHVDASGVAIGPVLSVAVSPNLRLISRQKLLRSRIRGWDSNPYARQPRENHEQLGLESSLGVNWRVPHREQWELGAEVLFTQLPRTTMTTLLGSITFRTAAAGFTRRDDRQKLYVAAGAGLVALRWQTGDATSVTAGREFAIGWKVAPWVAGEVAVLDGGTAVNNRQESVTYRYVYPSGVSQTTYITPWRIERNVSAASLGPRIEWPLGAGFSVITRQHAAVVTQTEQEDLHYRKEVHRSWVYRPTVGFDWQPPGANWLKLQVEGSQMRTARVRMVAWLASASVEF